MPERLSYSALAYPRGRAHQRSGCFAIPMGMTSSLCQGGSRGRWAPGYGGDYGFRNPALERAVVNIPQGNRPSSNCVTPSGDVAD
ncbi:MAG: hypothetical protein CM15mP103_06260 [Gammaproteobacteria bacterium]|nr:MAG: hypothetical protein CM15mP103_06260 [Gammaproteobacteria bacterium]